MELASYSIMNSLESLRIFGPHSWAFQQLMYLQYVHLDSGPRGAYHVRGWIGHFRWFGFWVRWGWGEAQNILCPTSWWRIQQMFTNSSGLRCKNIYTCQLLSHKHHKLLSGLIWGNPASFQPAKSTGCALASVPSNFRRILSKAWKLQVALEKICTDPPLIGVPICTHELCKLARCQPFEKTFSRVACRLSGILSFHAFHTLIAHSRPKMSTLDASIAPGRRIRVSDEVRRSRRKMTQEVDKQSFHIGLKPFKQMNRSAFDVLFAFWAFFWLSIRSFIFWYCIQILPLVCFI